MFVTKEINFKMLFKWTSADAIWLVVFMSAITALYYFEIITFHIPWLPISVIGTAVAFYVGFKNNQAYDRMWEARKIWGGIVNESRTWGMMVDGFITNKYAEELVSKDQLNAIKKKLIYRDIAWLYAHRNQLLFVEPWEHVSQTGIIGRSAKYYQRKFGVGLIDDDITMEGLIQFLEEDEYGRLISCKNTATQIINEQSRDLTELQDKGLIDDFRHMQMEDVLRSFYTLQGKNERIKKFPLPRQYANMSRIFVGIFIVLLPFGMIPELMSVTKWGIWLSIPITALVGWVYLMMEKVGDYSENPFQRMGNDIPMLSLCRTIEIDLREMLGESDLPKPIIARRGILM